jgi:hypothetical protein
MSADFFGHHRASEHGIDREWRENPATGIEDLVIAYHRARLAKPEFEEREGKPVNIDEINVQHFNRARRLRDRLIMIPRRPAQPAAETDVRSVEEIPDSAVCEALEDLSGVMQEN